MPEQEGKTIEIRGFLHLNKVFKDKNWPTPLILALEEPTTGAKLAERLELALDEIEIVFVNGFAQSMDFPIQPGDRIAFVPPGCPGPYRLALGFYSKNQGNKYNFVRK
ncbi:MAG: thiamine protein [Firmicutes bacterium]|nr:thiamine protein [Bacillota bacterium]